MKNNESFKKWMPPFILGVLLIIFMYTINFLPYIIESIQALFGALSPFILGAIIAYLLNIPRQKIDSLLQKPNISFLRKHHRGISVVAIYLLAIYGLIWGISAIVPIILVGVMDLGRIIPVHIETLVNSAIRVYYDNSFDEFFSESFLDMFLVENFDIQGSILNIFQTVTGGALVALTNIAMLPTSLFAIFLGFISSIYFILYSDVIVKFFVRILYAFIPKKGADTLLKYGRSLNFYFYKYIYCQLLDCLILGIIATLGLSIIGIEQAAMFGLLLAALNIIPYFGSIFGSIFVIVFIIFTDGFTTALISGLFLLVLQQLDGNLIQPKLMGSSLKLNPLFIIVSISIGSFYFGVLGMIVAIPIASLTRDIIMDLINHLENKKAKKTIVEKSHKQK